MKQWPPVESANVVICPSLFLEKCLRRRNSDELGPRRNYRTTHVTSQPDSVADSSIFIPRQKQTRPEPRHRLTAPDPPERRIGPPTSVPTQLPEIVSYESRAPTKGGGLGEYVPSRAVWWSVLGNSLGV